MKSCQTVTILFRPSFRAENTHRNNQQRQTARKIYKRHANAIRFRRTFGIGRHITARVVLRIIDHLNGPFRRVALAVPGANPPPTPSPERQTGGYPEGATRYGCARENALDTRNFFLVESGM